jgi:hypothetical protein
MMSHAQLRTAEIVALEFIEDIPAAKVSIGDIVHIQYLKTMRSESRFGLEDGHIHWLLSFAQRHGWDLQAWKQENDAYLAGLVAESKKRKVPA